MNQTDDVKTELEELFRAYDYKISYLREMQDHSIIAKIQVRLNNEFILEYSYSDIGLYNPCMMVNGSSNAIITLGYMSPRNIQKDINFCNRIITLL